MIVFGDKTFESLRKGLGVHRQAITKQGHHEIAEFEVHFSGEHWKVFRVWHPGNYGLYRAKVEEQFPQQLAYINEVLN